MEASQRRKSCLEGSLLNAQKPTTASILFNKTGSNAMATVRLCLRPLSTIVRDVGPREQQRHSVNGLGLIGYIRCYMEFYLEGLSIFRRP